MNAVKNKLATVSIPCRFAGKISYIDYGGKNIVIINPLNILGDFCTCFSYEKVSEYEQDNYILNENYKEHPFLLYSQLIGYEKIVLNVALITLLDFINSGERTDLRDFEIINQFHNLTFDFNIMLKKVNPLYLEESKIDLKNKYPWIKNNIDNPYQWETLSKRYGIKFSDMENEMKNDDYRFEYTCYSIEDMIFSVVHYLVFFGYKFTKCNHCDKYFAVKNYKTKFCSRKSPYDNYNEYDCKIAVHKLQTKFRNKFNRVEQSMMSNYNLSKETKFEYRKKYEKLYYDNYDEFGTEVKSIASSVEDLKKLEKYLYSKK